MELVPDLDKTVTWKRMTLQSDLSREHSSRSETAAMRAHRDSRPRSCFAGRSSHSPQEDKAVSEVLLRPIQHRLNSR